MPIERIGNGFFFLSILLLFQENFSYQFRNFKHNIIYLLAFVYFIALNVFDLEKHGSVPWIFLKNILVKLFWKIKYVPKIYKTIHNVLTKENSIPISFITSENFESYFQSSFKLRSHIPDNNYYSNFEVLQALGIKSDNIYMEHGLYLGNYFSQNLIGSHVKEIITMSDFRVNIAGDNGFEAIPIGPYIHYINSIHGRIVSEDYALAILSHASTKQRTEVNIEIEDYLIKIQKRIQKE